MSRLSHFFAQPGCLEDCGGVAYVASLPDAAASSDLLDQHVQILIGHYANRRILAWSAQTLASTEEHPFDKLIASAQSLISEILNHTQANKHTHIKHLATAAMRDIEENYSRQTATIGVPTGFEELDDLTGGFHRSELAVLAARTTVGKTAFAVNVSETAARNGHRVGILSLEMAGVELAKRLLSSVSSVNLRDVAKRINQETNVTRLVSCIKDVVKLPIYVDDSSNMSVTQLASKIRMMHADHGISLAVIDYLQLVHGDVRTDKRYIEIGEITKRLKGLAKELDIAVLALSQLNRATDDHRPSLKDLAESSAIEQDADTVILLHTIEAKSDLIRVRVAKQRNGPVGQCDLKFNRAITRFEKPNPVDDDDVPVVRQTDGLPSSKR